MSRLKYVEEGHQYYLDGQPILSNTQLLGETGFIDKTHYSEDGRERGSRVHTACWFEDEGVLDWKTVREEEVGYVKAFQKFKRETEWVTDFNELAVWGSPGFGTRLDLLGVGTLQIGGVFARRRAVVDLKSGSVPAWVALQTAGQKIAVIERIQAGDEEWAAHLEYFNGHPYPELRFALQLLKNGNYRLKEFSDPADEDTFRGLAHIKNWEKKNGVYRKAA